jgi:crossover junction endodeoxyribonuclease RuvC
MLVIGIDPGTAITGYGLVKENEDGSLQVVDYGAIFTPPSAKMPERLLELYNQLNQILLLHKPQSGAVEKLFFQRNVRTALAVGQARGVALLSLAQARLSIGEYTPLEVKQAITGYGGADKNQIQQMVKALLELKDIPRPDDIADALAVAICHIHRQRMDSLLEERNLDESG